MANKKSNIKCYASIAIIGVIAFWVLSLFFWFPDSTDIGILFSGLAFAGIIITALLQKEELKLQREELQLQREEIEKTRGEFKQQNATMKLQRFENTFFNLLNLLQKIVESIDDETRQLNGRVEVLRSRNVFRMKYNVLSGRLRNWENAFEVNQIYLDYYDKVKTDFGHYFRTVYQITKLIDETDFELDNNFEMQYKYASILRAQLSDYEMLWLFYHCLSEYGREKFKPLVEKYSFFKNMPKEVHCQSILREYDRNAFGK